ncbi:type 2 isopentenyl-diphosphate Delta-isomerase [Candidatus Geothermarchaeota archaeon]|nr:MAG: type 2 isopentenyl-diphosphate Delta-isomerase [Candidatus Geothermarchaeota archaeon]
MGVDIKERKLEHIKIVVEEDVSHTVTTWFEYIYLVHNSLPEADIDEVDTSTYFLGREFSYPILIDSMTGGVKGTEKINEKFALLADKYNIPISCGSQKAALNDSSVEYTYNIIREVSSDVFLIGNIGAQDLVNDPINTAEKVVEMIEANALAIHLNPLQEVIQRGTVNYKGVINTIEKVVDHLDVPVIVKETGSGISMGVAKILESIGVSAINVSGAGGTSWSAVEAIRNRLRDNRLLSEVGELYRGWGIPTAASLIEVVKSVEIPVISSGGIRSGLDIAKSLIIGATLAGLAAPFIRALYRGGFKELEYLFNKLVFELKLALFLAGIASVKELEKKNIPYIIIGPLREWLIQREVLSNE